MEGIRFKGIAHVVGEERVDLSDVLSEDSRLLEKAGSDQLWRTANSSLALAHRACEDVLSSVSTRDKSAISLLIVVSQSPDRVLPGLAPELQGALRLGTNVLSLDLSLGCAGFVQALLVATSLLEQGGSALIVTVDRYRSKIRSDSRATSSLFSDGASATIITSDQPTHIMAGACHYSEGTAGGALVQQSASDELFMDGRLVFQFTQSVVPQQIREAVDKAGIEFPEVRYFFVHQASGVVLSGLRKRLGVGEDRLPQAMQGIGNTTSSSIPGVMLQHLGEIEGFPLVLSGFGVGLAASTAVLIPI